MTEPPADLPRGVVLAALPPFLLSLAVAIACHAAAGASLGLYFGATLLATTIAPPVVLAHESLARRAFAYAGVVDGVGLVWLVAALRSDTSIGEWLACYLVVAAYVFSLAGVALAVRRLGADVVVASAVTVVIGLLWLTWPVWLSPWVAGDRGASVVGWLAPAHPLLAINGVVPHLGAWGEQQLAYHLTNLGQDVPYRLPAHVAASVVVHAIVGAALAFAGTRGSSGTEDEAPARPVGSLQ